jgi:mannosyl-3-phosphoglycerate phosphatase
MGKYIIFSDLDATLLDHEDYSYDKAKPALQEVKKQNIPLILNSSKTLPELKSIKREMGNLFPCVAENGSVIDWCCEKGVEVMGANISDILTILNNLKNEFNFRGFSDYTVQELAAEINMPVEKTKLAKTRLGSEPLKWFDSNEKFIEFEQKILENGLQILKGGRFFHIMGRVDKSMALIKIKKHYEHIYGPLISIALGDSPNDRLMLEFADIGILIPNPCTELWAQNSNFIKASQPGSAGWNKQILKILKKVGK